MSATLGDFLNELDVAGELHRVPVEVSPVLEIAVIADRQSKSACPEASRHARSFDPGHCGLGGRALLFEKVAGSDFPLCINVFGSYRRMEMALGCREGGFASLARRIEVLAKPQPPRGLRDLLSKAKAFLPLLRTPPRRVRRGVCQEVVLRTQRGEVDLRRLPLIQCWPLDGDLASVGWDMTAEEAGRPAGQDLTGRYITFAGMHTIHADDADEKRPASHNIGMYRAQLLDATHMVMHWHIHHDGAAHWRSWKRAGRRMPIAICFGGETVMPYAATAPLPPGISELLMAGFLNGRGIPVCRAATVPLWVPANSEIVIEGWVSTECGPIGYLPDRRDGRIATHIALVCDAGTPLISDPGYYLVNRAVEANIPLIPIPGPSSLLTALCVSGLPTDRFIFEGFVPRKPGVREKFFAKLENETGTIILFETQHRILKTLRAIQKTMGNRQIVLTRELTKINEEILRGNVEEICQQLEGKSIKGEITLLIQGHPQRKNKQASFADSLSIT